LRVQEPPGTAGNGENFANTKDSRGIRRLASGSRLAFTTMDSSGQFSVFVRDFDSLDSKVVRGSEGAHGIFWPPDGRSLYLTANAKLWRSPLQSDANVLLSDSPPFLFSGLWLSPERILLDSFRGSYFVSSSGGPSNNSEKSISGPSSCRTASTSCTCVGLHGPADCKRGHFACVISHRRI
jgi:hypothetical protein